MINIYLIDLLNKFIISGKVKISVLLNVSFLTWGFYFQIYIPLDMKTVDRNSVSF